MDEVWQKAPFTVHPASHMQVLLGHASAVSPLLEALKNGQVDLHFIRNGFLQILARLRAWEDEFASAGLFYLTVTPSEMDLPTDPLRLPDPCFIFADVSHANSLTHCWAFRIVCLLQLCGLENTFATSGNLTSCSTDKFYADVKCLCKLVCQGLPYLLQKEMRFYGSMSAVFPLHMVSESLQTLKLDDDDLRTWCTAIKEQMQSQRVALYEEMTETGTSL